jgi:hypothetical protein
MVCEPEIAVGVASGAIALTAIGALVKLGTIGLPWPLPVHQLWRGEVGLARTYWVWYMLVVIPLFSLLLRTGIAVNYATGSPFMSEVAAGLGLIASLFFAVAIWQSANYYKGPTTNKVLARAASILTVVWTVFFLTGLIANFTWLKTVEFHPRAMHKWLYGLTGPAGDEPLKEQ